MSIYEFKAVDAMGIEVSLEEYEGKVMLIINSATQCGFTSQYDGLQDMYEKYGEEGFVILDFPCNQFGNQAPGTEEEIVLFCDSRYGITFPIFSKTEVKGQNAHPLFQYLVGEKPFTGFDPEDEGSVFLDSMLGRMNPEYQKEPDIKWNFTKFLVDRSGKVVERFEPTKDIYKVAARVEEML